MTSATIWVGARGEEGPTGCARCPDGRLCESCYEKWTRWYTKRPRASIREPQWKIPASVSELPEPSPAKRAVVTSIFDRHDEDWYTSDGTSVSTLDAGRSPSEYVASTHRCQRCHYDEQRRKRPEWIGSDPRLPRHKTNRKTDVAPPESSSWRTMRSKGKPFDPNSTRGRYGLNSFKWRYTDANVLHRLEHPQFPGYPGPHFPVVFGIEAFDSWDGYQSKVPQPCVECGGSGHVPTDEALGWQTGPRRRSSSQPSEGDPEDDEPDEKLTLASDTGVVEVDDEFIASPTPAFPEYEEDDDQLDLDTEDSPRVVRCIRADDPKRKKYCQKETTVDTETWRSSRGSWICDHCLNEEKIMPETELPERKDDALRDEWIVTAITFGQSVDQAVAHANGLGWEISKRNARRIVGVDEALALRRAARDVVVLYLNRAEGREPDEIVEFFRDLEGAISENTVRTIIRRDGLDENAQRALDALVRDGLPGPPSANARWWFDLACEIVRGDAGWYEDPANIRALVAKARTRIRK